MEEQEKRLEQIAGLIDKVIYNPENSIVGRDALMLRNAVDDLRKIAREVPA